MQTIKILLTCTNFVWLEGMKAILQRQRDLEIIGEARRGNHLLALLKEKKPDVLLLDPFIPGCDPKEILTFIRAAGLDTKIILFTGMHGRKSQDRSIGFGIGGYYHVDNSPEVLFWMIRSIYWGEELA